MERIEMTSNGGNQLVADPVPFARSYQLEALEKALTQNTVVFFETGTGKTLISIMLLRSYAHLLKKPSPNIAVFLVPTVVLVTQQAGAIAMHTDLKVGKYYGELGVDYWDAARWKLEKGKHEVLVMTPQILLDALRHRFFKIEEIKVLIFDECHNARGKHPYASIMTEFYHRELASNNVELPRVFGMTASPIKAKALSSDAAYWKQISELENLMNSKVFTCDSDTVLTKYIPFSTPKLKIYEHIDIPHETYDFLEYGLTSLVKKHEHSLIDSNISESVADSVKEKLNKLSSTLMFCLNELGIWLAMQAAQIYSREQDSIFPWVTINVHGEKVVRAFSVDAVILFSAWMPSGPDWSIGYDLTANMTAGYITPKVMCLVETLLEYRDVNDLRCIVFVERVVTAIAIRSLLNELPRLSGWKTEYTAGNNSQLQSQSRKEQNAIIEEFRKGKVNIIVATSMLEEGLDVQSCNLVIRFDPSATICSFIQSRGRARMQNSDFILIVKSDDCSARARVDNYLASGDIMRKECLRHANVPCEPLEEEMYGEAWYKVESTGAIVTLRSSVQLLYFYCSRLPSDGYFKPYPRCTIYKELESCTLQLPNSAPIQTITINGNPKFLKQEACLAACMKLHQIGALTDNLVPEIVEEEAEAQESECTTGSKAYFDEHAKYFPPELVSSCSHDSETLYHLYSIDMNPDFQYDIKFRDVVLAIHTMPENDLEMLTLDLDVGRGKLVVRVKYIGHIKLASNLVALCQRFQATLLSVLIHHNSNKLLEDLHTNENGSPSFSYLLLPSTRSNENISIDWKCIFGVLYTNNASGFEHTDCFSSRGLRHHVHTKSGLACQCLLENALVCTPHNGYIYCVSGTLDGFDGNTYLELRDGECVTYKQYYELRHEIKLEFEGQTLLKGKRVFAVHNYLQRCRIPTAKESSNTSFELPPELCLIIMAPISISMVYTYSFLPSIMHRIESLLLAANLKNDHVDHCMQNVPTLMILEAITTMKCQEKYHLESLETFGDSFLKYAATQQLFKTYQNRHEGLLSLKRERIISNATLCRMGCDRKITGFIRNEQFDPKTWIIPGTNCANCILEEETPSSRKFYSGEKRKIKSKTVADVTEALIGACLSAGGEMMALTFMSWLGITVDFDIVPYARNVAANPERHVNVGYLESLLNYKFQDVTLLVEALTHGSYMLPEIPACYQRLEFLGDAVLDYCITTHLYNKYPGLSPGLLTDLRSASVNNDCYAQSTIKVGLYKHILHASPDLFRQIANTVRDFEELCLTSTFGWESETSFPKVLGDVIESLAGAILVDSGYNKDTVFESMRPLLEPLVTPETLRLHPVRELTELCQREHYILKKPLFSSQNGVPCVTIEVEANGVVHEMTCFESDKKMAKRLACKAVLKSLKESVSTE